VVFQKKNVNILRRPSIGLRRVGAWPPKPCSNLSNLTDCWITGYTSDINRTI